MKISFLIPAIVLYVARVALSNSVQVGTVLFTTTDLVRRCWTESDKSLLKARLIMQDVLPDPDCIDFSNPDVVAILLEYFHSCYKIISTNTYGKIQNLMYLALSDALGGYLRGYVLPFTRRAYYAGQVKYLDAKKLFRLYEDIKVFLKTNGVGWIEPQKVCPTKIHVRPLVITGGSLEACEELYVIEKEGKLHCINPRPKFDKDTVSRVQFHKNQKESFREDAGKLPRTEGSNLKGKHNPEISTKRRRPESSFENFRNSSRCSQKSFSDFAAMISRNRTRKSARMKERSECRSCGCEGNLGETNTHGSLKRVIVPLPVLDDCVSPHSIAVPLIKQPFRNLKSGTSAFVLEYYYLAVVKCFIAKGNTRSDLLNFNEHLYTWLQCQVLPHLSAEEWYPGFGGVLRVMQTIKKFGIQKTYKDPALQDIAFMFSSGSEFDAPDNFGDKGRNKVREVEGYEESQYSRRHVVTAVIIASMIWLFIFCSCAFYCQATRGRRLLYEGCSPPPQPRPPCPKKKPNTVNFQFLVRFFKRDDDPKCTPAGDSWELKKARAEKTVAEATNKRKTLKEKLQEALDETNYFSPLLNCSFPTYPYLNSFNKVWSQKPEAVGDGKSRNQGQGDQVQMLWKKPSVTFEGRERKSRKKRCLSTLDGARSGPGLGRSSSNSCSACFEGVSKDYSSEKRSSTCYCSESCPFVQTTTTTTTTATTTELADKLSSATLEFFEEVIGKRKLRPSITQESTAESETECSTTSETDY